MIGGTLVGVGSRCWVGSSIVLFSVIEGDMDGVNTKLVVGVFSGDLSTEPVLKGNRVQLAKARLINAINENRW